MYVWGVLFSVWVFKSSRLSVHKLLLLRDGGIPHLTIPGVVWVSVYVWYTLTASRPPTQREGISPE